MVPVGIYKMSVDGSGLARLTDSTGDYDPAWSSDGRWIAFASKRDGGVRNTCVVEYREGADTP